MSRHVVGPKGESRGRPAPRPPDTAAADPEAPRRPRGAPADGDRPPPPPRNRRRGAAITGGTGSGTGPKRPPTRRIRPPGRGGSGQRNPPPSRSTPLHGSDTVNSRKRSAQGSGNCHRRRVPPQFPPPPGHPPAGPPAGRERAASRPHPGTPRTPVTPTGVRAHDDAPRARPGRTGAPRGHDGSCGCGQRRTGHEVGDGRDGETGPDGEHRRDEGGAARRTGVVRGARTPTAGRHGSSGPPVAQGVHP